MSVFHKGEDDEKGKIIKISELHEGENDIGGAKIVRPEGMTDKQAYDTFDNPDTANAVPNVESYGNSTTIVVGDTLKIKGKTVVASSSSKPSKANASISVTARDGATAYACNNMVVESYDFTTN